jgi:2-polyprenyl-3-methyl-5-hydroxy-6-metoxy-1,4-benzoquinol methylase
MSVTAAEQLASKGDSSEEIHAAALRFAAPLRGLDWLDLGCGRGHILREVAARHAPGSLTGVDAIDWLDPDLREAVRLIVGPAEQAELPRSDRVLMIEVIEHLEAPWTVLRRAAGAVRPGGVIVVTTPSVANLRSRLELLARGRLTSFRPENIPHLGPALPHVVERILGEAGMRTEVRHCGRDVVPKTAGRCWPRRVHELAPELTSVSVAVIGRATG